MISTFTFSDEHHPNVEILNFGEQSYTKGYTGVVLLLRIDNQKKWVKLHEKLDPDRILALIMWSKTNDFKLSVTVDNLSFDFPTIKYLKLNALDFEV